MRTFSPAIQAHILSGITRAIQLFTLVTSEGTVRLTTANRHITIGEDIYYAAGTLLSVEAMEETLNLEVTHTTVKLSGLAEEVASLVTNTNIIGCEVMMWQCFCDENWEVIDDPILVFNGYMDSLQFATAQGQAVISGECVSEWIRYKDLKNRITNPSQHHSLFGRHDAFFDQVPALIEKELIA